MRNYMPTCSFCGKTATAVETAVEAGWRPNFRVDKGEVSQGGNEVCPECADRHLDCDGDDEPVIKPGHERFISSKRS